MKPKLLFRILLFWAIFDVLFLLVLWLSGAGEAWVWPATFRYSIVWIGLCGGATWLARDRLRDLAGKLPVKGITRFLLVATLFALLEEAIAVCTGIYSDHPQNLLLPRVLLSMSSYVGMFLGLWWALSKYEFKTWEAFLVFGTSGYVIETIYSPSSLVYNTLIFPFWLFIYGLMVLLAVLATADELSAKSRRESGWKYVWGIVAPTSAGLASAMIVAIILHVFGVKGL